MCAHALCDFQLQNPVMWQHKNKTEGDPHWYYWMTAHALICAGGVYTITSSLGLAATELCIHWVIDHCKQQGMIDWHHDQLLHILCRISYVFILF